MLPSYNRRPATPTYIKFGIFMVSLLCIVLGLSVICGGIWLGIWHMLIGGIVMVVEACKANPVDSYHVAIGVAKIIFCELPCVVGLLIGILIMKAGIK